MRTRHHRRAPQAVCLFIFTLVLLNIAAVLPVAAQSTGNSIAWAAVDGAALYRVEITQEGRQVLETFTEETVLPLFIPEGDYEFTVTVFNSFGREVSRTEPSSLAIRTVKDPLIVAVSPRVAAEGAAPALTVRTANLEEGARFSLIYGEETYSLDAMVTGEDEWTLTFEEGVKLRPGEGHLRVVQPSGREDLYMRALRVVDIRKLKIKAITPDRLASGGSYADVTVYGEGLLPGIRFSLDGPEVIESSDPRTDPSGETVVLAFDLSAAAAGNYDLVALGPDETEISKEEFFQVTKPVGTSGVRSLEADKRPPKPLPPFPRGLTFGYRAAIPIGDAADYLEIGPVGLSVSYLEPLVNDLFRRTPVLRNLWWEFGLGAVSHEIIYSLETIDAIILQLSVGFRYVSDWKSPVQLVVRFAGGLSFTFVGGSDSGIPMNDASTLDYFISAGLGAEIVLSRRWALELGADVDGTFYLTRTSGSVKPYLNGIWRF